MPTQPGTFASSRPEIPCWKRLRSTATVPQLSSKLVETVMRMLAPDFVRVRLKKSLEQITTIRSREKRISLEETSQFARMVYSNVL